MLASTGCYVATDTLMKLSTAGLPPYETLALRGASATLWGLLFLRVLRLGKDAPALFNGWVWLRNCLELAAVLCYVVALTNLPIANVVAILQMTPLVVLIGAALVFRERLSPLIIFLIVLGFVGALLVARPSGNGLSVFSLLAVATAVLSGLRDLVSRCVSPKIPGLIVAFGASILVLAGALIMHLVAEETVMPDPYHFVYLAGSGLFLFAGHFLLFTAYRFGPTEVVAPLYYFVALWAILAGAFVFRTVPDVMSVVGIAIVTLSGVAIIVLSGNLRTRQPS